jgi:hypothetical protein
LNPLSRSISANAPTPSNGNLDWSTPSGSTTTTGWPFVLGTIGANSGKWYYELNISVIETNSVIWGGWFTPDVINDSDNTDQFSKMYGFVIRNDSVSTGLRSAVGSTQTTRDGADATTGIYQIAFDFDSGKFWIGKNNTWYASGNPSAGTSEIGNFSAGLLMLPFIGCQKGDADGDSTVSMNFGQRPFAYTPPSGFKALNSYNIAEVTDDLEQPDFVWIKARNLSQNHALFDSVRGVQTLLKSNSTDADATDVNSLLQFNKNGFLLGSSAAVNTVNEPYVAWVWKAGLSTVTNTSGTISSQVRANPTSGFSIVTYTGTGSSGTVGH